MGMDVLSLKGNSTKDFPVRKNKNRIKISGQRTGESREEKINIWYRQNINHKR